MNTPLDRLKNLTSKISGYEIARKENIDFLKTLYRFLHINEKVDCFEDIFLFKAINLSGISLKEEEVGKIKAGKYLQILAISYDKDALIKSKNISLGYFGRVETVEKRLQEDIVEFVLRWRFEKSFKTLEHYHEMIKKIKQGA